MYRNELFRIKSSEMGQVTVHNKFERIDIKMLLFFKEMSVLLPWQLELKTSTSYFIANFCDNMLYVHSYTYILSHTQMHICRPKSDVMCAPTQTLSWTEWT